MHSTNQVEWQIAQSINPQESSMVPQAPNKTHPTTKTHRRTTHEKAPQRIEYWTPVMTSPLKTRQTAPST